MTTSGQEIGGASRGEPVSREPDPSREAELRQIVISYIMNHRDMSIDQAAAEDLLTIASDGSYNDTLPLMTRGNAYRGVSVSAGWFERNFGVSYDELIARNPGKGTGPRDKNFSVIHTFEKQGAIKPTGPVPVISWSKDKQVAMDFATGGGASNSDYSVPIVYQAGARGNSLIDLTKSAYYLEPRYGYALESRAQEQEVLSVGPVSVSKVHVIGWKYRKSEKTMPTVPKSVGAGYDNLGRPTPGLEDQIRDIDRRELDPYFDRLGIPDIG